MNIKDKLLNEDKVKRQLKRSQDAMNKMFSGKLSKRSRIAKKQRKIAMGPMSKVSVNTSDVDDTSDREDSQTMLNIKDKISETLLNSFNKLLNEGGRSNPERTEDRKRRQAQGELEGDIKGKQVPHRVPPDQGNPEGGFGHHFKNTARNRRMLKRKRKAVETLFGKEALHPFTRNPQDFGK